MSRLARLCSEWRFLAQNIGTCFNTQLAADCNSTMHALRSLPNGERRYSHLHRWTTLYFRRDSRIAFELYANINPEPNTKSEWNIYLPNGEYSVKFEYHVDRNTDWYDFLAKRSRFAGITPIWRGTQTSNAVNITIADAK